MIQLRDYQQAAIDGIYEYFAANDGNPLCVLPTGSGKSVIIAEFCRSVVSAWPDQKIIMLTHVKELIEQNFEKLCALWPFAPAGIYSASLNSRDTQHSIIFAGIQSVYKRAFDFGRVDLVLIDECHLVNNSSQGMYRDFLAGLYQINPLLKIIGFTATHFRLKQGLLTDGKDRIFTDVAYELPIKHLLTSGYLAPVRTKCATTEIDLSNVKTVAGDYVKSDQEKAVHKDGFTASAIAEIMALGRDRRSWLIFCPSVKYAEEVADILQSEGISSACVTGSTDKHERERILSQYKSGQIRCVTNCDVLTTGFDAPATDLLVLLRSTKSTALYIQIVGRGMRAAPDKRDCLVLDFGGNVERHGPIDAITVLSKKRSGNKVHTAPTKKCPDCREIISAFVQICPVCMHEFPRKPAHEHTASTAAILSEDIKPEWLEVSDVSYSRHIKEGKPDSLKATYRCGLQYYFEWVFFEHYGHAQARAVRWWKKHSDSMPPATVTQALEFIEEVGIRKPYRVEIKKAGKYFEVLDHDFAYRSEIEIAETISSDIDEEIPF